MKRDMELVRQILLALTGNDEARARSMERSTEERAYHVALMIEAGLLVGKVHNNADEQPQGYFVSRLTWAGHDFLDAVSDNGIWEKAKETVLKPVGGAAFDVLLEWLKWQAKQKLGMPES